MHINELEALIRLMGQKSKRQDDPLGRKFLESDGTALKMNLSDMMHFLHFYYDPFVAGKLSLPKE